MCAIAARVSSGRRGSAEDRRGASPPRQPTRNTRQGPTFGHGVRRSSRHGTSLRRPPSWLAPEWGPPSSGVAPLPRPELPTVSPPPLRRRSPGTFARASSLTSLVALASLQRTSSVANVGRYSYLIKKRLPPADLTGTSLVRALRPPFSPTKLRIDLRSCPSMRFRESESETRACHPRPI